MLDKDYERLSLTAYCHVELVETLTGSGFRTVNGCLKNNMLKRN